MGKSKQTLAEIGLELEVKEKRIGRAIRFFSMVLKDQGISPLMHTRTLFSEIKENTASGGGCLLWQHRGQEIQVQVDLKISSQPGAVGDGVEFDPQAGTVRLSHAPKLTAKLPWEIHTAWCYLMQPETFGSWARAFVAGGHDQFVVFVDFEKRCDEFRCILSLPFTVTVTS